jgi:hypothetical protein
VKALEYDRYDINGYYFWTAKLEEIHPLATTTNNGVVANGEDASGLAADYYDILQNIIEYMFGGNKELKIVFFKCDWFDPVNGNRVDNFGMVEVKHESRSMRLPRSQRSKRPNRRLLRSRTSRTRLMTSHRSPTG